MNANVDHPWEREAPSVLEALGADPASGLEPEEARRRLESLGRNELVERGQRPAWHVLFGQFANTMTVVLAVAAVVTVAIGEVTDALVIAAIVVANAVIGFLQEFRAERAMEALRGMSAPEARVVRGGAPRRIPADELVPGDVMQLEAGDLVPADGRILDAPGLRVTEAALTGESVPSDKRARGLAPGEGATIPSRDNMVFRGTAVAAGRGVAVVTATGMTTEIGRIAAMLQERRAPRTPLQRRLATLGRWLAALAISVAAVVFVSGVLRGEDPTLMFLTAVSLAVAAIPEALPAVVTVALALGAQRMARRHALVRKLPAVETLGSVTVICSDKTGTLTEGRMRAERLWLAGHTLHPDDGSVWEQARSQPAEADRLRRLLEVAVLCNDAELGDGTPDGIGDPTELALLRLAAGAGEDVGAVRSSSPRVDEIPFDAERRRMTTLHERGPEVLVATKGAPEAVLPLLEGTDVDEVERAAADLAGGGYRVLAIAGKRGHGLPERPEEGLSLFGLVGLADGLRAGVVGAVAEAREAGIEPVMITGDHPSTAGAIAARAGIAHHGSVVTGAELARMSDEELTELVGRARVFARIEPAQKLRLVEAWGNRGEIVAMTGDGVNDAPALRRAHIGVAMGITGTGVAKEAADMVLADDDFVTIVAAVREGRRIYDNVRRFVRYMLTANSGEVWVIFLAPFLGLPLPLLPIQILWINLVTDGLPAVALGLEPAEREIMARPPRDPRETIFARGLGVQVFLIGLVVGLVPLLLGAWAHATGRPFRTIVFTTLALLQLGNALALRSDREGEGTERLRGNPFLPISVAATALLQIAILYWGVAQDLLHVRPLGATDLAIVLVASTSVFWIVRAERHLRRRRAREALTR